MSEEKSKIENTEEKPFVNPIDPDKIAENAAFLPFAVTVGGAVIKPEDMGREKGNAVTAMYEQTDRQMLQLREQMETLVAQARDLKKRQEVSEEIYEAAMSFRPVMGHTYHLYRRKIDGTPLISLVSPDEWGNRCPYDFVATVKLLYDHTWEILEVAEAEEL